MQEPDLTLLHSISFLIRLTVCSETNFVFYFPLARIHLAIHVHMRWTGYFILLLVFGLMLKKARANFKL
jgi:hypothetical protein